MSFAAYNAGPHNLKKFRAFAQQRASIRTSGSQCRVGRRQNPGVWAVQYVSNIYKYYIAYQLSVERLNANRKANEGMRTQN